MAVRLFLAGQERLLRHWPPRGVNDAQKRQLIRTASSKLSSIASDTTKERLATLKAPAALQKPHALTHHGDTRQDPYYWLRDDARKDPDVLQYIAAENEYCKAVLADTEELQEALFQEMKGRIQETDQSATVRRGGFYYYTRTLDGQQYSVHCRRRVPEGSGPEAETTDMDLSVPEEVLLDENKEAAKHKFYSVGGFAVSPDGACLAYSVDTVGGERYTVHVLDLATRKSLCPCPIPGTSGTVVWAADNKTLFYVKQDDKHRPFQVFRYEVGTETATAVSVFEEVDEEYWVSIGKSRDEELVLIHSGAALQNESLYIHADDPTAAFKVLIPRESNVEYEFTHWHGSLVMVKRTAETPNSAILVAPLTAPEDQRLVLEHRSDVKIMDVELSERFLAVLQRRAGLPECHVYPMPLSSPAGASPQIDTSQGSNLSFEEPAYDLCFGRQGDFASNVLALSFTSLATPRTALAHNMATGNRVVKKVTPVLGGFDQQAYVTERLWAPSHDGVKIPISLVYNKQLVQPRTAAPLHLTAYGAYEVCNDPAFSSARVSLLDRGIVYAIAHVRGGGELGRLHYEDGKFLKKKNTFLDVVAAAELLTQEGWTSPSRMTLEGRSAGGMTVGAVANMRPDLFNGIVMGVPFVDVLTTMLDDSIPLTTMEWDEWGCPKNEEYYHYMKSYSPMDNVARQDYPNILITAGLHDPRVAYWEPLKFVAKLRKNKTDSNILVIKVDLGAGHFSQSGRFDHLRELTTDYAFIIKCTGQLK